MQTVIILRGAPACGKTMWAHKYMDKHPNFIVIGEDAIRLVCSQYDSYKADKFYRKAVLVLLQSALACGLNVIIDDYNYSDARIRRIRQVVDEFVKNQIESTTSSIIPEVSCFIKDFNTPLEICALRNSMRAWPYPERKLRTMYNLIQHKRENM